MGELAEPLQRRPVGRPRRAASAGIPDQRRGARSPRARDCGGRAAAARAARGPGRAPRRAVPPAPSGRRPRAAATRSCRRQTARTQARSGGGIGLMRPKVAIRRGGCKKGRMKPCALPARPRRSPPARPRSRTRPRRWPSSRSTSISAPARPTTNIGWTRWRPCSTPMTASRPRATEGEERPQGAGRARRRRRPDRRRTGRAAEPCTDPDRRGPAPSRCAAEPATRSR